MERKIGEIFEFCGKWYQCLKSDGSCADCAFLRSSCGSINDKGICRHDLRKDATNVIFKKLEKIGETYQYMDGIYQQYKATLPFFIKDATYIETTNGFAIKQNKEDMNKLNLKPFDLESAKSGKPVYTRDGRKAVFLTTLQNKRFPVVAIVNCGQEENIYQYDINGICDENDDALDLMMLSEKKEGWVNVYNNPTTHNIYTSADVFESKEIAEEQGTQRNRIATCKITWEE